MPDMPAFGKKAGQRSPAKPKKRTFSAQFPGECPGCWDRIEEGDEVVHEECL